MNDYRLRASNQEDECVLHFFFNSYEEDLQRKGKECNAINANLGSDEEVDETRTRGRPRNERAQYQTGHPKAGEKQRVKRSRKHCNLPNIVGQWLPRRDDEDNQELYFASMLTLLKPWRDVKVDLKDTGETWKEAFDCFINTDKERLTFTLSNIQYIHQCASAADRASRLGEHIGDGAGEMTERERVADEGMEDNEFDLGEGVEDGENEFTDAGLQQAIKEQTSLADYLYGRLAVESAAKANFFPSDTAKWTIGEGGGPSNATGGDLQDLHRWKESMKQDVQRMNTHTEALTDFGPGIDDPGSIEKITESTAPSSGHIIAMQAEQSLPSVDVKKLRKDQRRAYDIITWHLRHTLAGNNPPPLRMILYGEGGTGKSKVIQTVTTAFALAGALYLLIKAAYTGKFSLFKTNQDLPTTYRDRCIPYRRENHPCDR